jgi:hypothetical protein
MWHTKGSRMSTNTNKKRLGAVAATVAVALVGGGLAVAYWTTTGTGTGSGAVGTDTPVTVTQTSTVTGLVPGGPAQELDFTIDNGAAGPQTINDVAISITDVTAPGACSAADFSITQPDLGAPSVELAVGNTSFSSATGGDVENTTAAVAMVNSASNQNGCKGATLEFTYDVS